MFFIISHTKTKQKHFNNLFQTCLIIDYVCTAVHYKTMGWLKDSVSRLIGALRVRQQRVREGNIS